MSNQEEVRTVAEHVAKGWHVAEGDTGNKGPGHRHQVWYGPALVVAGIRDLARAETVARDRAREEAATAEESWLKADVYLSFCRAEVERLS